MVIGTLPNISLTMPSGRKIPRVCSLTVYDVDSRVSQIEENPGLIDGTSSSNENSSTENSSSGHSPLDSPGGIRERIKQMQVEAEIRRDEFARLLEEHAQVVRKLKMMEAEEQLSSTHVDGTATGTGTGTVVASTHA
ncbi:uncharacterized protein V1477_005882 [Vespula maculifrons]|uniref:Uncharacterized protein n=5 Tax=Vespula TaxID=7451 RepID=A0A834NPL9_VESGE|nr:uncharacterized protein LOC122637795 [Vespula pensylvanica]XP_050869055.1 uncharacterized protein LOC127072581 [Vespula vulgaris]KAF7408764.1 hypothetical protein HZH66_003301 [Vespula vulgaris]KAF7415195.1 hypothetical protein HZH68_003684 [Vespula germanica]KAF7435897.1 hypothetical protein H0235_004088 [Vespula pensylvanica]